MVYDPKKIGCGKKRLRGGQCRKAGAVVWQWVPTFKEAVPPPPPRALPPPPPPGPISRQDSRAGGVLFQSPRRRICFGQLGAEIAFPGHLSPCNLTPQTQFSSNYQRLIFRATPLPSVYQIACSCSVDTKRGACIEFPDKLLPGIRVQVRRKRWNRDVVAGRKGYVTGQKFGVIQ